MSKKKPAQPSLFEKTNYIIWSFIQNKNRRPFLSSRLVIAEALTRTVFENNHIFIHINKTAGSSISKMLTEERHHLTAVSLRDMVGEEAWRSKFKFTIVRNPWDRVVSQYHYRYENNQQGIRDAELSFKTWVKAVYQERRPELINVYSMFLPQYDWISMPDGEVAVDFIGRFENLAEDIAFIKRKLNITAPLPRIRSSLRDHYSKYYDDETRDIVGDYFKKDIDFFGYTFEQQT